MSTKYVKDGGTISWDNDTGSAVAVNQVVLIPTQQVAVASAAIADAATGPVIVSGVVNLASAAVTITADDPLYATLGASPAVTNVGTSSNYFIGWAEKDAAASAGVNVRLAPFCEAPIQFHKRLANSVTSSATAITLTAASFSTIAHTVIASAAGTQAVATPALAEGIAQGQVLIVKKTGSAGAVTITAGTGTTIAGGATYATLDAQNDVAIFVFIGTDWVLTTNNIA